MEDLVQEEYLSKGRLELENRVKALLGYYTSVGRGSTTAFT
jgi:hypothetical protein